MPFDTTYAMNAHLAELSKLGCRLPFTRTEPANSLVPRTPRFPEDSPNR